MAQAAEPVGKPLVTLSDGRAIGVVDGDSITVGDTLISEGMARPYNGGRRKGWCSRDSRDDLIPGSPPSAPRRPRMVRRPSAANL